MFTKRAKYEVVSDKDDMLIIRDVGHNLGHPTVTNDAESIVADLAERLGARRLFYIDSEDQLDELVVKDGKFCGFSPTGAL